MAFSFVLLRSALLACCLAQSRFPENFKFGVSTSAYQIEGAWNEDGKGESICDRYVHTTYQILDNSTGDVAANSYHFWNRDISLAKDLGVKIYRFSISWTRILPTGFNNNINKGGIIYYNKLIDAMLQAGIEPMVTMYHGDLPQRLQDLGGWTNPNIISWYSDYARVVFSTFGDRVKYWITINEPVIVCQIGYGSKDSMPGINEQLLAPYLCNKYILMSHAAAYRIYDIEYRYKYKGVLSLSNNFQWYQPANPSIKEEGWLSEKYIQEFIDMYAYPVYSKVGGWPKLYVDEVYINSLKAGFNHSVLPEFTAEEVKFVKGTADFFALNYYGSSQIRVTNRNNWQDNHVIEPIPGSFNTAFDGYYVYPPGIRNTISWINKRYGKQDIWFTENGFPTEEQNIHDKNRTTSIIEHLQEILLSIRKDGHTVLAYTYWSLLDNFEWSYGYTIKFGLHYIDFKHPKRPAMRRESAYLYECVIRNHGLDKCINNKTVS